MSLRRQRIIRDRKTQASGAAVPARRVQRSSASRGVQRSSAAIRQRSILLQTFWRRRRSIALVVAALPLFQATGCYPDPVGALNFNLQLLVNNTLITALSTYVSNVFRL